MVMGLLSRLFARKPTEPRQPTKGEVITTLINAYGAALTAHSESGSAVSDISRLPAPKDTMRAVLIAAISAAEDKAFREQLKGAYVMLAEFQPGVGSPVIKIDTDASRSGDIREHAARVATQADLYLKWSARVTPEMEQLQKDLAALG
jgi:hypothetical protein